jgi:hypothetical protein
MVTHKVSPSIALVVNGRSMFRSRIPRISGECCKWKVLKLIEPSTYKAVAAFDVMVEELEWEVSGESLDPQSHLSKVDGHRV